MKTTLKRIIFLSLSVLILFSAYLFASPLDSDASMPVLQMSRIDFEADVDSVQAQQIKNTIYRMEGVQHVYFNVKDDIVVYSHDPKVISNQEVYSSIMSQYTLSAKRYIVDTEMAASSCPITGKNSVYARIKSGVKSLFQ